MHSIDSLRIRNHVQNANLNIFHCEKKSCKYSTHPKVDKQLCNINGFESGSFFRLICYALKKQTKKLNILTHTLAHILNKYMGYSEQHSLILFGVP